MTPLLFASLARAPHSSTRRWLQLVFIAGVFLLQPSGAGADEGDAPGETPRSTKRLVLPLGLTLIRLEPATFVMGSAITEPDRNKAEGPQMTVTFTKGFWLGATEVTQQQYEAVTGSNPSRFKEAGPHAPVENVSWDDAMKFCEKLTEIERAAGRLPEGYAYTLPTEAQWEYACRAEATGSYSGDPAQTAWTANNSQETTHPVATKRPNAWGFFDLNGNVLEWCRDWYGDYPGGEQTDPTGPRSGYYRMARGGSWRTNTTLCRITARSGGSQGRRDYTLGFRLALCATP